MAQELEAESKWATLTKLYLLSLLQEGVEAAAEHHAHARLETASTPLLAGGGGGRAGAPSRVDMLGEMHDKIAAVVERLVAVDGTRRSYYRDLESRSRLRLACAKAAHPGQTAGAGARAARLCGLGLTSLSDLSLVRLLGIRELDLSDNELSDVDGVQILHGLTTLHANRCRLRSLAALAAMPHLLALSICDNGLPRVCEALQPLAAARPALASLQASGNSYVDKTALESLFPACQILV